MRQGRRRRRQHTHGTYISQIQSIGSSVCAVRAPHHTSWGGVCTIHTYACVCSFTPRTLASVSTRMRTTYESYTCRARLFIGDALLGASVCRDGVARGERRRFGRVRDAARASVCQHWSRTTDVPERPKHRRTTHRVRLACARLHGPPKRRVHIQHTDTNKHTAGIQTVTAAAASPRERPDNVAARGLSSIYCL